MLFESKKVRAIRAMIRDVKMATNAHEARNAIVDPIDDMCWYHHKSVNPQTQVMWDALTEMWDSGRLHGDNLTAADLEEFKRLLVVMLDGAITAFKRTGD